MAALTTAVSIQAAPSRQGASMPSISCVRRRIDPKSGKALELLGHAIEYLTDEFVNGGGSLCGRSDQLEAIQILMAVNRQIYYDCPKVPSWSQRVRTFLGVEAA